MNRIALLVVLAVMTVPVFSQDSGPEEPEQTEILVPELILQVEELAIEQGKVGDVGIYGFFFPNMEGVGFIVGALFDLGKPIQGAGGVDIGGDAIDGFGGKGH